jgi:hypothetical protein
MSEAYLRFVKETDRTRRAARDKARGERHRSGNDPRGEASSGFSRHLTKTLIKGFTLRKFSGKEGQFYDNWEEEFLHYARLQELGPDDPALVELLRLYLDEGALRYFKMQHFRSRALYRHVAPTMRRRYGPKGRSALACQLQNMQCQPGESVRDYILRYRELMMDVFPSLGIEDDATLTSLKGNLLQGPGLALRKEFEPIRAHIIMAKSVDALADLLEAMEGSAGTGKSSKKAARRTRSPDHDLSFAGIPSFDCAALTNGSKPENKGHSKDTTAEGYTPKAGIDYDDEGKPWKNLHPEKDEEGHDICRHCGERGHNRLRCSRWLRRYRYRPDVNIAMQESGYQRTDTGFRKILRSPSRERPARDKSQTRGDKGAKGQKGRSGGRAGKPKNVSFKDGEPARGKRSKPEETPDEDSDNGGAKEKKPMGKVPPASLPNINLLLFDNQSADISALITSPPGNDSVRVPVWTTPQSGETYRRLLSVTNLLPRDSRTVLGSSAMSTRGVGLPNVPTRIGAFVAQLIIVCLLWTSVWLTRVTSTGCGARASVITVVGAAAAAAGVSTPTCGGAVWFWRARRCRACRVIIALFKGILCLLQKPKVLSTLLFLCMLHVADARELDRSIPASPSLKWRTTPGKLTAECPLGRNPLGVTIDNIPGVQQESVELESLELLPGLPQSPMSPSQTQPTGCSHALAALVNLGTTNQLTNSAPPPVAVLGTHRNPRTPPRRILATQGARPQDSSPHENRPAEAPTCTRDGLTSWKRFHELVNIINKHNIGEQYHRNQTSSDKKPHLAAFEVLFGALGLAIVEQTAIQIKSNLQMLEHYTYISTRQLDSLSEGITLVSKQNPATIKRVPSEVPGIKQITPVVLGPLGEVRTEGIRSGTRGAYGSSSHAFKKETTVSIIGCMNHLGAAATCSHAIPAYMARLILDINLTFHALGMEGLKQRVLSFDRAWRKSATNQGSPLVYRGVLPAMSAWHAIFQFMLTIVVAFVAMWWATGECRGTVRTRSRRGQARPRRRKLLSGSTMGPAPKIPRHLEGVINVMTSLETDSTSVNTVGKEPALQGTFVSLKDGCKLGRPACCPELQKWQARTLAKHSQQSTPFTVPLPHTYQESHGRVRPLVNPPVEGEPSVMPLMAIRIPDVTCGTPAEPGSASVLSCQVEPEIDYDVVCREYSVDDYLVLADNGRVKFEDYNATWLSSDSRKDWTTENYKGEAKQYVRGGMGFMTEAKVRYCRGLLDTGADISLVTAEMAERNNLEIHPFKTGDYPKVRQADGSQLHWEGYVVGGLFLCGRVYPHVWFVAAEGAMPPEYDTIIGTDLLCKIGYIAVDFDRRKIILKDRRAKAEYVFTTQQRKCIIHTGGPGKWELDQTKEAQRESADSDESDEAPRRKPANKKRKTPSEPSTPRTPQTDPSNDVPDLSDPTMTSEGGGDLDTTIETPQAPPPKNKWGRSASKTSREPQRRRDSNRTWQTPPQVTTRRRSPRTDREETPRREDTPPTDPASDGERDETPTEGEAPEEEEEGEVPLSPIRADRTHRDARGLDDSGTTFEYANGVARYPSRGSPLTSTPRRQTASEDQEEESDHPPLPFNRRSKGGQIIMNDSDTQDDWDELPRHMRGKGKRGRGRPPKKRNQGKQGARAVRVHSKSKPGPTSEDSSSEFSGESDNDYSEQDHLIRAIRNCLSPQYKEPDLRDLRVNMLSLTVTPTSPTEKHESHTTRPSAEVKTGTGEGQRADQKETTGNDPKGDIPEILSSADINKWAEEPTPEEAQAIANAASIPTTTKTLTSDPTLPVPECTLTTEEKDQCQAYNITEKSLTSQEKLRLLAVILEYSDIFATKKMELGECNTATHHIDTGDNSPIFCNPYKMPEAQRQQLRDELDAMEAAGIIEKSRSPWAAPIIYVPKKDGTQRLCVDLRKLNGAASGLAYPLPDITTMYARFEGARFFTALDLACGFWQIALDLESRPKTAFTTVFGQYQFIRMPFGLATAPGAFQKIMNEVLGEINWKFCMCYVDDVVIFSPTFEEHLVHLSEVFSRLRQANLKVKLSKCEFARTQLHYLGHVVNRQGRTTDPAKVEAIAKMDPPQCMMHLETFLGKVGYYSVYIPFYADLTKPLNDLRKKYAVWHWGPVQQAAFDRLKELLTTAPVLRHPDFTKQFIVQTDASGYGLGAVLSQMFEDGEHPVAYASRTLQPRETRWATIEKEALAIRWAVTKVFHHYLYGTKFSGPD